MSELPVEYLVAVNEFMAMIARGEEPPLQVIHDCGYDVHVLQQCMDVIAPYLNLLDGYKPLVVWLRGTDDIRIESEQNLKPYKSVLLIKRLYVRVDSFQTVDVYVGRDGHYIVTIMGEIVRSDLFPNDRIVRVIECGSARDIAVVLNTMQLQENPFAGSREATRIVSTLMCIVEKLRAKFELRTRQHETELSYLQSLVKGMAKAAKP